MNIVHLPDVNNYMRLHKKHSKVSKKMQLKRRLSEFLLSLENNMTIGSGIEQSTKSTSFWQNDQMVKNASDVLNI